METPTAEQTVALTPNAVLPDAAMDNAAAAVSRPAPVSSKAKVKDVPAKKSAHRGVVYISRVPPFMKPEKLRHLLGQYGDIGRLFLVPEDKAQHRKRVSNGGNKKTKFTEGWIEFLDRKVAKHVAEMLNTTQIGGRKRDFHHDDMWMLKYLKGFKWEHLTEKMAYEKRIRSQKLRMEIAQAKKENDAYLERVEQSKRLAQMEKRKTSQQHGNVPKEADQVRRVFAQKRPASEAMGSASAATNVLDKVFRTQRNGNSDAKKRKVDQATT